MPIAAPLIAGAVTAGATIYAGNKADKAVSQATAAETESNAAALALQERMYNQQRSDYEPWRQVGIGALQQLARTYNIPLPAGSMGTAPGAPGAPGSPAGPMGSPQPGTAPQPARSLSQAIAEAQAAVKPTGKLITDAAARAKAAQDATAAYRAQQAQQPVNYAQVQPYTDIKTPDAPGLITTTAAPGTMPANAPAGADPRFGDFFASPDYQFRLDQGLRGVTGNRAARGLLDSGALGKGLINYAEGAASQEYGGWFARLSSLAGLGSAATNASTQAGLDTAARQQGIIQNQGQNLSSSYETRGGIQAGLIQNLGSVGSGLIQNWPQRAAPQPYDGYSLQGLY